MITLAYGGNPVIWVVIAVLVLLLFGGNRIPEMMRGLGQGMKEFKKGMNESEDDELRRDREAHSQEEAEREREIRARVEAEMRRERESKGKEAQ